MATTLFWISLGTIFLTFFGYPAILVLASLLIRSSVKRGAYFPTVTVIIPVFNGSAHIEDKLNNCLRFDYPEGKMKIIVASDASEDDTDAIVRRFTSDRVRLVRVPFRGGKVVAQNFALQFCDSEIVVFTDVAIKNRSNAIRTIVENFYDPTVGVVSCRDAIIDGNDQDEGEGRYIQYDMKVRQLSSQAGNIIGVTGGFYAMRLDIAEGGWNPAFPPDFYAAIRCIKKGFRVVEDARVKAYYKTASKGTDELSRKVRTINRGMHALLSRSNIELLNPLKYRWIALQFLFHKLMRWLGPLLFIMFFCASAAMTGEGLFYTLCFAAQLTGIVFGIGAFVFHDRIPSWRITRMAQFFLMANYAILRAWADFFIGKTYVKWEPTKR